MEKIVGELENKASGKLYQVKWDLENETALIEFEPGKCIVVGKSVKNEMVAIELAKDYLKYQEFI